MAVKGKVIEKTQTKVKQPKRYQVILHNDDFTPMDFVVEILMEIYQKSEDDAIALMLEVHKGGFAIVGIYSYDIAMTKASLTRERAKEAGHPLQISVDEA